jgi:hypothetical protein
VQGRTTLRLPITFKPGFSGPKNLYTLVQTSLNPFWFLSGSWTVP